MRIIVPAASITLCLTLAACGSAPKETATPPAAASATATPAAQRFDLRGKVVSVDKAGKTLTVDHEDIPGFMGAMTMPYAVKDGALLEHLTPGEQVTAKVVSSGGNTWLEDVVVVAAKPAPAK
jgi:protein SCO1/2